ncbi:MAG: adenine phosphoribosyltransferase [Synechococcaceae cyanobacterium]|nr:adenine phosphoribosyltransferase [Synechococcaceae cyanobacterium]
MTDPRIATAPGPLTGEDLRAWIREYPDFPRPGILFRCITVLLRDPRGWRQAMLQLGEVASRLAPDVIVGIESRGFLVGGALATSLELPFIPVRKPGKLPGEVHRVSYELEYGSDSLEMHCDALSGGARVLLVDDLLATGGTAAAAGDLIGRAGGALVGYAFLIELAALNGRAALAEGVPVESLIRYD